MKKPKSSSSAHHTARPPKKSKHKKLAPLHYSTQSISPSKKPGQFTHSSTFASKPAIHPLFKLFLKNPGIHPLFNSPTLQSFMWFAKLGDFIFASALGSFLQYTYTLFASFDILAELSKIGQFMYPNIYMGGVFTFQLVLAHPGLAWDGFNSESASRRSCGSTM
jgi:hypothetical protein